MLDLVGNPEDRFSQNDARIQADLRSNLASGTFFDEELFSLPPIQEEQVFKLLAKEWALNIGKLPLGGLSRNILVTYRPDMTSAVYIGSNKSNKQTK